MKKIFASAIFFFVIFTFGSMVSFGQNETKNPAAQIIIYNNDEKPLRPRIVGETVKVSAFDFERKILEIINGKRATIGMKPLVWSEKVARVARLHSENMARYKFFSHIGQDGTAVDDRADLIGLRRWKAIGENIAYNRGFSNPIESVCESWMKSNSHRENLLNSRWQETGIGVAIAPDGTYFYTQVFLAK